MGIYISEILSRSNRNKIGLNMIYETERLYTREMNENDLSALSSIMQDPEVMYAYEHAFTDEETSGWFNQQLERYKNHGYGLWAVILKETSEMIGQCGLSIQQFRGSKVQEIGYLFRKAFWHQGYAIEAARGCKAYAFDTLELSEVYSIVRDTNITSMNVAIRNGMTIRGRFIKHYYGVYMPHYAFSVKNKR